MEGIKTIKVVNEKHWQSHKKPETVTGKTILLVGANSKCFCD